MEEQIFSWSLDGFGSRLFRIGLEDKVRFVNRYSSMDEDESRNADCHFSEVEYGSFTEFWKEFTDQPVWLHYRPIFIHRDVRLAVRESLNAIPQGSIPISEMLRLNLWFFKTDVEN